jgi:hypothetical protein
MSQYPGIDTMRVPDLCQFPARLLEPQLLTQGCRFPSLPDGHRSYLLQGVVEPQLADFQRRKVPVPLPTWTGARARFDILDDEAGDREDPTQERGEPQFPLPAGQRGGRNFLACVMAVLTWLAARRLPLAACAAHAGALLFSDLHARTRLSLDVQVGMRCREDAIPLALAARVDANGDGLRCAARRLDVEAQAEDAPFPEACCLAALEPASRSCGRGRHQRLLALIDDRNKDVRHVR